MLKVFNVLFFNLKNLSDEVTRISKKNGLLVL